MTLAWSRIFLIEAIVLWISSEATSNSRAVYMVRQGENTTVTCWKTWFSRYKDARYTWLDHLGRGAARNDMVLHGDGTMEITDAQLADTDTFTCTIHLAGNSTENHTHTVIVYTIAEYYMSYPFIYYVTECDYQLNNFKLHELHEFVCRDYEKNCPFHAVSTCHKYQSTVSQVERSQLIVFIEQHPLDVYRPPSCDVLCIKKSIVEHFDLMGSYIIREMYNMEQNSQRKIYGNIVFSREMSARLADVKARCQSGYELYQDIICMPCYPGHSLKYTYSAEEELAASRSRVLQRCEACSADQFQDSFGMEECFYCPRETYTNTNGSVSQELCRKKGLPISWTLMILCGLLAAFLAAICCTWLIMACVSGTRKWTTKKVVEGSVVTASVYPPLNEQHPWIELMRQCEESVRTSPTGSPRPLLSSPSAAGASASGPSVSLRSSLRPQQQQQRLSTDASPDLFVGGRGSPVDGYPSSAQTEYYPIQPRPASPYAATPTPLAPVPIAMATSHLLAEQQFSLVSLRPSLRPPVRQPAALVPKQSDTNIYRQALMSGLREVRIVPPGSSAGLSSEVEGRWQKQPSRTSSVENWSQHSGSAAYQALRGPNITSSNSKPIALPDHLEPPPPPPPFSTSSQSLSRDPSSTSGVIPLERPSRGHHGNTLAVEVGRRSRTPRAVEIEVEFQRVPPAAASRSRTLSSPPHPTTTPGSQSRGAAAAPAFGQQSNKTTPTPQSAGLRQISKHQPQLGVTPPRNLSTGTTEQPRITGLPLMQSTGSMFWPQRIDNQPQSFGRGSIPWTRSEQEIVEGEQLEKKDLEQYHVRLQSSGSIQDSDQAEPQSRLPSKGRRSSGAALMDSQTPSQRSSETTQQPPSVRSSEIGQYYAEDSRQSSEVDQSVTVSSRKSSEMEHQHRQQRSSMATHHRRHNPRSVAEAASSQEPQQRGMRKALLDAINARSAPTHEDTNVYD